MLLYNKYLGVIMTFQSLKNFLRGGSSKLDNLEKRIRRIEHELSRMSFRGTNNQREDQSSQVNRQKSIEEKRRELSRKSDTVHTQEGWKRPKTQKIQGQQSQVREPQKNDLPNKIGAKEKMFLEFECPKCGSLNSRGIQHSHVDEINDHTDYYLHFTCSNCGWESDLVNIRATN